MQSVKTGVLSLFAVFFSLAVSGAAEAQAQPNGIQGSGKGATPFCFVGPLISPLCLLGLSK
jgi:hypothetical protein